MRLEALKQQLIELEKQYEKEKPLINLVDNMVKLGSLYRGPMVAGGSKQLQSPESATLDRLEFNQRMQERRLLQEEQRQWDRTSPNHVELQVRAPASGQGERSSFTAHHTVHLISVQGAAAVPDRQADAGGIRHLAGIAAG